MKREQVDAVMPIPVPLFYTHRARLVELTMRERLPLIGFVSEWADAEARLAYGVSNIEVARRGAGYVARILRGAKPSELLLQADQVIT